MAHFPDSKFNLNGGENMSSLDIVARAVLMENGLFEAKEESKWKRRGKTALKYGAAAAGLGGLGYAGIKAHRYMQGGGLPGFQGIPGANEFGNTLGRPNRYGQLAAKITPEMRRVGKIGLGAGAIGVAGYGGYKLYKHLRAKKAAQKAAKEAYYRTYMNLMEAEDEKSSFMKRHKWIRRGAKTALATGTGYVGHKLLGKYAPEAYGKFTGDVAKKVGDYADKAGKALGRASSKLKDVKFPPTGIEQFG